MKRRHIMHLRQMKDAQLLLILHGLRAIYVHDMEETRIDMIDKVEQELLVRGITLGE